MGSALTLDLIAVLGTLLVLIFIPAPRLVTFLQFTSLGVCALWGTILIYAYYHYASTAPHDMLGVIAVIALGCVLFGAIIHPPLPDMLVQHFQSNTEADDADVDEATEDEEPLTTESNKPPESVVTADQSHLIGTDGRHDASLDDPMAQLHRMAHTLQDRLRTTGEPSVEHYPVKQNMKQPQMLFT
jgi:hypothetical protein